MSSNLPSDLNSGSDNPISSLPSTLSSPSPSTLLSAVAIENKISIASAQPAIIASLPNQEPGKVIQESSTLNIEQQQLSNFIPVHAPVQMVPVTSIPTALKTDANVSVESSSGGVVTPVQLKPGGNFVVVNMKNLTSSDATSGSTSIATTSGSNVRKVVRLTPQQLLEAQKLAASKSSGVASLIVGGSSVRAVAVTSAIKLDKVTTADSANSTNSISSIAPSKPQPSGLPNIIRNSSNTGNSSKSSVLAPSVNVSSSSIKSKDINETPKKRNLADTNKENEDVSSSDKETANDVHPSEKQDSQKTISNDMEVLLSPLDHNQNQSNEGNSSVVKMLSGKVNCAPNEFGAIEVTDEVIKTEIKKEKPDEDEEIDLTCREDVPPLSPRTSGLRDDELLCCAGCGRYGLFGDFEDARSCSSECQQRVAERMKEKEKKEKELMMQRQRREAKRRERERERRIREAQEKNVEEQRKCHVDATISSAPMQPFQPILETSRQEETIDNRKSQSATEDDQNKQILAVTANAPLVKQPTSYFNQNYPWYDPVWGFSWMRYLDYTGAKAAPAKLFEEQLPKTPIGRDFDVGMKLEAIDPEHPSLICVATIAEIQGCRLRLHFDTYSDSYDFWEDNDSPYIFPAGWAQSRGLKLQPPRGYENEEFQWKKYLAKTKSCSAPNDCFPLRAKMPSIHGWEVGLKLEAADKHNACMVCVATVAKVMDGRVLIHFDGWEMDYDYWVAPHSSPYVHPVGWCEQSGVNLNPPKNYADPSNFNWAKYLNDTQSRAVPSHAFKAPKGIEISPFKKGYKLEAVDKRNPSLIRVATVAEVIGRQLKIHYDGWSDDYDIWVDDESPLLHPAAWCFKTGHPLMPPLTPEEVRNCSRSGCPTPGCRNIGHVLGARYVSHLSPTGCPYALQNINCPEPKIPDRLQSAPKEEDEPDDSAVSMDGDSLPTPSKSLGRGNRRRKRRKFFDEDGEDNGHGKNSVASLFNRFKNRSSKSHEEEDYYGEEDDEDEDELDDDEDDIIRSKVRKSVFRSDDPFKASSSRIFKQSRFVAASQNVDSQAVLVWTSDQVAALVCSVLGLGVDCAIAQKIIDEQVDGESFLMMSRGDLVDGLGLRLGPAIKLHNAIELIRANVHGLS